MPTRGIEGLYSPMVGRDRDLHTLQAKVQELTDGRGQIVSVMGEAGLGKSRLVSELRKWVLDIKRLQLRGKTAMRTLNRASAGTKGAPYLTTTTLPTRLLLPY